MKTIFRIYMIIVHQLIILIALAGYQTWTICDEFFKYQTTTFVTLEKSLEETIAPQVGFRIFHHTKWYYGSPLSKLFQSINDIIEIIKGVVIVRRTIVWYAQKSRQNEGAYHN